MRRCIDSHVCLGTDVNAMEVTIPLDYDGDTLKVIAVFNPDSEEQVDYSKVRYASPHASPHATPRL